MKYHKARLNIYHQYAKFSQRPQLRQRTESALGMILEREDCRGFPLSISRNLLDVSFPQPG
jgi:hypothetical protein